MASMMPAYSQTSIGSLPEIDEATKPFSSFLDNFDRATITATVPLADKAIFLVEDGRRYKFERIPDRTAEESEDRVGAIVSSVHNPVSTSPTSGSQALRPGHVAPTREYQPANNAAAIRRRPVSGTSAGLQQHASGRGPPEDIDTRGANGTSNAADDLSPMMAQLNVRRFSATPFFADSDGGVLAAETLMDPAPNPRLPIPPSPTAQHATAQPQISMLRSPNYQTPSFTPQLYLGGRYPSQPPLMSPAVDHCYGYQSPELDAQHHGTRHASLPSVVTQSSPIPHSSPTHDMYVSPGSPHQQPGYFQTAPQSYLNVDYGSPPQNASSPAISYLRNPTHDEERRRSDGSAHYGPLTGPPAQPFRAYNIPIGESHFDTQTPVVVIPGSRPHSRPQQGSTSSGASTGRDNVLPGEDVLFDGPVKIAQNLSSTFLAATLKVFRNTLSNDLRFHSKVGYDAETYWMKGSNAQLIPVYAYDQRFPNVIYIRDNDTDKRNGATSPNPGGNAQPGGFYQFSHIQEVSDFQAKLTGEKVLLDISSVRLLRFRRSSSRSNESFSSVRVQIWHEEGALRKGPQSDGASFVTAGTAVSGPLRERRVPNLSRLIVFLGRLDEYITVFITDDLEAVPEGQTMVRIRARKGSKFKRSVSRWQGVKGHLESKKGSEPAGFNIDGQKTDPDIIYSFDLYESFDIEFESSPSQDNFVRKWDEVIKERRLQRMNLDQIDEGMKTKTFTSKDAREIW